jgi:hypothetical protein
MAARGGTIAGSTPAAYPFVLWGSWREDARTIFLPLSLSRDDNAAWRPGETKEETVAPRRSGMVAHTRSSIGGPAARLPRVSCRRDSGPARLLLVKVGLVSGPWIFLASFPAVGLSRLDILDHHQMGRGVVSVSEFAIREWDNLRSCRTGMVCIVRRPCEL